MNGLRPYQRDPSLPVLVGDGDLTVPLPEEIVALVGQHMVEGGGPRPVRADWVHARWKPHTAISACFEVSFSDGAQRLVTWKRYKGPKAEHLRRHFAPDRYAREQARPLLPFAVDAARGIALLTFPADRALDGIARVFDLRRTAHQIDRLGILGPWVVRRRPSRVTLLRYKPERRAVLRLDLELRGREDGRERAGRVLAARVLPPAVARRVAQRRELVFAHPGAPRAPRLLALERRPGVLLEEWCALAGVDRPSLAAAEQAAGVLAALHGVPAECSRHPLGADAADMRELFAADARLSELAGQIEPPPALERQCWIHGDAHAEQFVLDPAGRPLLLDLDELRAGHPAQDLAAWIADRIVLHPESGFERVAAPLLEGYAAAGGRLPERGQLAAWTGHELARRAAASIRRLEQDACARARDLLCLALRVQEAVRSAL